MVASPNRPGRMLPQLESALTHITLAWKGRGNPHWHGRDGAIHSTISYCLVSELLTGSSYGDGSQLKQKRLE